MDGQSLPRTADKHPPPGQPQAETKTCAACAGAGEVVTDVRYTYSTGELQTELTRCAGCKGTGSVKADRPYLQTMAEVRAHRRRIEAAQRKAEDASRAVALLADDPRAPQEQVKKALRRLDEAAAELRSMGVIA